MKLSKVQAEFLQDVAKLINYAFDNGIMLTLGDGYRPIDLQYLYYYGYKVQDDNGKLSLIKARRRSKTLNSKHQKRLAIDFNFFIDGQLTYKKNDLLILGEYWESLHDKNTWGGNFKTFIDTPHFERSV